MYTRLAHYAAALAKLYQPLLLLMPRDRVIAVTGREWGKQEPQKNLTLTLLTSPESTKYNLDSRVSGLSNRAIDQALEGSVAEGDKLIREAELAINEQSHDIPPIITQARRAQSLAIQALLLQAADKPKESLATLRQATILMKPIYPFRTAVFFEYENIVKISALLRIKWGDYKRAEDIFEKIWTEINIPENRSASNWIIAGVNYSSLQIIQEKIKPAARILNDCVKYCDPLDDLIRDVATHNLKIINRTQNTPQTFPSPPSLYTSFSLNY